MSDRSCNACVHALFGDTVLVDSESVTVVAEAFCVCRNAAMDVGVRGVHLRGYSEGLRAGHYRATPGKNNAEMPAAGIPECGSPPQVR